MQIYCERANWQPHFSCQPVKYAHSTLHLKAVDTISNYSKKNVSIKTYLVSSNVELLVSIRHCEKRLPLK